MILGEIQRLLRLEERPRRILVVEDDASHYNAMLQWLAREGHVVSAFGEIHDLTDGVLTGATLDGHPTSVEVATLDAAFLDFYFPRKPWNGGRLVRALIAVNPQIRIFGMSSVGAKNAEMFSAGAVGGMLKRDLGALIR